MDKIRDVSSGMKGADVYAVQAALNYHIRCAGPPLALDGIFGPKTDGRLRKFQKLNTLKADGIVGPRTRRMLFRFATANVDLDCTATQPGEALKPDQEGTQTRRTIIFPKEYGTFQFPNLNFPHYSLPPSPYIILPPVGPPPTPDPQVKEKPPVVIFPLKLEWDFSLFQKPDDDIDPKRDADINFDQKFKFILHYPIPNPGADPKRRLDPNKNAEDAEAARTEFSFESGQQPSGRWRFKAGAETKIASFKLIGPLQLEIFSKAEFTLPTGKMEFSGGGNLSFSVGRVLEIKAGPLMKLEVDPRVGTIKASPDLAGAGSLKLNVFF